MEREASHSLQLSSCACLCVEQLKGQRIDSSDPNYGKLCNTVFTHEVMYNETKGGEEPVRVRKKEVDL
ncbi:unnamed protein product [Gongylonema pulchrum]|uniref:Ovule protein n=1 Tax=Gongylonema pulchrum TaxID=637853 RepID=A0A183F0B3_9BILA|nr:unnamed protein product [Gongylonema pulchrum]